MLTRFNPEAPHPDWTLEPVNSRFRERVVGHPQAISVRTQCDKLPACSRLLIIRLFQLTPISWGYRWAGITEFLQHPYLLIARRLTPSPQRGGN